MRKIYDAAVVVLFLAAILTPLLTGLLTRDRQWSEAEKRALAAFPERPGDWQGVVSFLHSFERYYNDHFGLREYFISRYHKEMEKRFDLAGSPLVLKGQGGWYFIPATICSGIFAARWCLARANWRSGMPGKRRAGGGWRIAASPT